METANYDCLDKKIFERVYEPSEDTFILIDALEKDIAVIKSKKPQICLEIGSGSGVVIASLAKVLGPAVVYLSTDKNPDASLATLRTSENNGICINPVVTNLVECLLTRLAGSIDVLLFNPPYVATPFEEINGDQLQMATAGGNRGREIIDQLLPMISGLLSPEGLFYLVCIKDNDIEDLLKVSSKTWGLEGSIVISRRCGIETLFVLKFSLNSS